MDDDKTDATPSKKPKKMKLFSGNKNSKKVVFIVILILISLVFIISLYLKYSSLKKENELLSNPQEASKIENEKIQEQVGKLVLIPENESVSIFTVSDMSRLKDNPFYVNAEIGDKVLIFDKSKKIILYRQSVNKVINISVVENKSNLNNSEDKPNQ